MKRTGEEKREINLYNGSLPEELEQQGWARPDPFCSPRGQQESKHWSDLQLPGSWGVGVYGRGAARMHRG